MSQHNSHCPYVMKNTDHFYVKICSCGCVHMSFGATIVNMSPEVLLAVQSTLGEVIQRFEKSGRAQLLTPPHTANKYSN